MVENVETGLRARGMRGGWIFAAAVVAALQLGPTHLSLRSSRT